MPGGDPMPPSPAPASFLTVTGCVCSCEGVCGGSEPVSSSILHLHHELGVGTGPLTMYKYIINKDLLYSTGNYAQYLLITCDGKESEKEKKIHVYIYIWASLVAQPVNIPPARRAQGDLGSIPGSGRSPGGGHGNTLQ